MDFNIERWKEFVVGRILKCETTPLSVKADLDDGDIPFVSRTAENNGCDGYVSVQPSVLSKGNCLTVGAEGIYSFYQFKNFATGNKIYTLRNDELNIYHYMFLSTILNMEDYRYNYGRARIKSKLEKEIIQLPILENKDGIPYIDEEKTYSDDGYIPDWHFMESYIKSLNCEPLTTKIDRKGILNLNIENWEEFYLKDLFDCCMGNGIDASATTDYEPIYNYVSRDSKGNGVVGFVDEVKKTDKSGNVVSEKPFQAGTMTLALGGSFLGSCFVQKEPYYTAQNVAVLTEKEPLTIKTKIFISTLVRNECKYKYIAFGRELNTHYKTDFSIKLPVKTDEKGQPIIDETHTYSEKGYIPDWQFMNDYINSLPYSDRI